MNKAAVALALVAVAYLAFAGIGSANFVKFNKHHGHGFEHEGGLIGHKLHKLHKLKHGHHGHHGHHQPEHKPEHHQPEHKPEHHQPEHKPEHHQPEHKPEHHQPEHKPEHHQPEHKPEHHQPEHKPEHHQPEHKPEQHQPEHKCPEHKCPEPKCHEHQPGHEEHEHEHEHHHHHHQPEHKGHNHGHKHRPEKEHRHRHHHKNKHHGGNHKHGHKGGKHHRGHGHGSSGFGGGAIGGVAGGFRDHDSHNAGFESHNHIGDRKRLEGRKNFFAGENKGFDADVHHGHEDENSGIHKHQVINKNKLIVKDQTKAVNDVDGFHNRHNDDDSAHFDAHDNRFSGGSASSKFNHDQEFDNDFKGRISGEHDSGAGAIGVGAVGGDVETF